MRALRLIGAIALMFMVAGACDRRPAPPPPAPAANDGAAHASAKDGDVAPVGVEFSNADLGVAPGVVLHVRQLRGQLRPRARGRPLVFDDQRSFIVHVDDGEVALTPESLSRLLNDRVFAYDGAPISNVEIAIEGGRLKQKGKLHKGVVVPFSTESEISVTADGRVRLHPLKIKAIGLPIKGFMKLLHLELDDLVNTEEAPAVRIEDNDFILDTSRLLDAPRMEGRLTAVRIESNRIVEVFGRGAQPLSPPADSASRNYLYFHGGTLRFGKLTMHDTDMQLIDADPSDPFDFVPQKYVRQLTAGYTKNMASGALRVYMPDFGEAGGVDLRPSKRSKH